MHDNLKNQYEEDKKIFNTPYLFWEQKSKDDSDWKTLEDHPTWSPIINYRRKKYQDIPLSNGKTLTFKFNEAGGITWWCDDIGGGHIIWDTSLTDQTTLLAVLTVHNMIFKE